MASESPILSQSSNGIHSEHPLASITDSQPNPSSTVASTTKPANDSPVSKAVDNVLYSDIGLNTLVNRLKQSIASAKSLSGFLKKRSQLEDENASHLKRLCKSTMDGVRSREVRQGSYANQFEEIIRINEHISDNGVKFSLNLHQMSQDLESLAHDMEMKRKHWKQTAQLNESRVQEAEKALEKAKQKYDQLAEHYDLAKTGDKVPGRHFGLRQRSASQQEEDLARKLGIADADYQSKVQNAQQIREEVENTSRPQAVQALLQLTQETDAATTLQLQKFASFNESLVLGNGFLINPMTTGESSRKGLKELVSNIDNDQDFNSHITSYTTSVPIRKEIKYQKHPSLIAQLQPKMSYNADAGTSKPNFNPITPTPSSGPSGPPVLPISSSFEPLTERPFQSQNQSGFRGPNNEQYSSPVANNQSTPTPTSPISSSQPYGSYNQNSQSPGYMRSNHGQQSSISSPLNPTNQINPGNQTQSQTHANPSFGLSLQEIFNRDDIPVPTVVEQCILAVDHYGLDIVGIYRTSGAASQVTQLKSNFDADRLGVDFRYPETFFQDINNVATLLKQYLRELPDPLLTHRSSRHFLDAAAIPDDIVRRDRLHAVINELPDPNYATLRDLTLHLHRVVQHSAVNRMNATNLAVIFAPTLMGQSTSVTDATLQHKAIETIVLNAHQIFDDE